MEAVRLSFVTDVICNDHKLTMRQLKDDNEQTKQARMATALALNWERELSPSQIGVVLNTDMAELIILMRDAEQQLKSNPTFKEYISGLKTRVYGRC